MSSFDGKLLKLYFARTILYEFNSCIKWHKHFLFIDLFRSFEDSKLLWSHLVKSEKESEKH